MSIGIIRKKINTEIRLKLQGRECLFGVFGFGSFFRADIFNDIDLLVVTKDECKNPLDEFYLIKEKLNEISLRYDIPIDITYLSYTEYSRKSLLESDSLITIISK